MNFKKTKDVIFNKESGITLIALVITIIVLLILAGVSISTLVGDDGIIAKAQVAKIADEISKEETALDLAVISSKVNNDGGSVAINKTTLAEELQGLQEEGTITKFDPTNVTDDVTGVTITGTSGTEYLLNLETGEMKQAPTLGTVVENYNTEQGLEWKVFYVEKDTTSKYYGDVYLITSDCVPIEKLPTTALLRKGGNYNGYWDSSTLAFQTNSGELSLSETLKCFKGTGYDISLETNKGNLNSQAVSTLLNTSNWTDFVDSNYADYAIGGPTIEMWVASWNDNYTTETDKTDALWCSGTGSSGYYVGTGITIGTSTYISSPTMKAFEGFQNTLYYPHTSAYKNCYGYWCASPSVERQ